MKKRKFLNLILKGINFHFEDYITLNMPYATPRTYC